MNSEASICSMALSHLGDSKGIAALDDRSASARACLQWYTHCRDELLSRFPWPFATVPGETLALVETFTASADEWRYSYAYPASALRVVRSPWGATRDPTVDTEVRHRIVRSDSGRLLYLDQDAATVEYIKQVTDVNEFSALFITALTFLIAWRIARQVVGESAGKVAVEMQQEYELAFSRAAAVALSEQTLDPEPRSGFETARD